MQYNITIKHKPGILNKADTLSQRPDYPHKPESEWETAFPNSMFIDAISVGTTIPAIMAAQHNHQEYLESLSNNYPLIQNDHLWFYKTNKLVVLENNEL